MTLSFPAQESAEPELTPQPRVSEDSFRLAWGRLRTLRFWTQH